MKSESTKTLMINLAIGVLVVSILYVGYSSLKKDGKINQPVNSPSSEFQEQALLTSQQVARTYNEFDNLKRSVVNSVAVFSLPAFQELKDHSIEVYPEPIGRANPFSQTDWKARLGPTAL